MGTAGQYGLVPCGGGLERDLDIGCCLGHVRLVAASDVPAPGRDDRGYCRSDGGVTGADSAVGASNLRPFLHGFRKPA
ncbi:hypothetical protein D3C71_1977830 [compost metagenome]